MALKKGRVVAKLATNLTKEELAQCLRMGYPDGCIRDDLKVVRRMPWTRSKVVMLKEGDAVRSWALIDQTYGQSARPMVQIWTRPKFRKRGFGARVMARVRKITGGKQDVYYGQAPEFFDKTGAGGP